jgi:hypothetical protein
MMGKGKQVNANKKKVRSYCVNSKGGAFGADIKRDK